SSRARRSVVMVIALVADRSSSVGSLAPGSHSPSARRRRRLSASTWNFRPDGVSSPESRSAGVTVLLTSGCPPSMVDGREHYKIFTPLGQHSTPLDSFYFHF